MWGAYLFVGITVTYVLWVLWLMRPWGSEAECCTKKRLEYMELKRVKVIDHKNSLVIDEQFLDKLKNL